MPEPLNDARVRTHTQSHIGGHLSAHLLVWMMVAAFVLSARAPASADRLLSFRITTGSIAGVSTAEVNADGMVLIRLRSAGGGSLVPKAEAVAARLTDLAVEGLKPGQVKVEQLQGEWSVTGAGKLIITADADTAAAAGLAPRDLCESWRARVAEVLSEPYFCIDPRDVLLVPYGEQRSIRFGGTVAAKPAVECMAAAIATVELRDGRVVVRGVGAGATVVVFDIGALQHAITIEVKKWAAQIGAAAVLHTLPAGVPEPMRAPALLNAALSAVRAEPRAIVRLEGLAPTSGGYTASLRATGTEYLPVTKVLPVTVRSGLSAIAQPQSLLISNAPEKVEGTGALMRQSLATRVPSRVMWHHKNYAGRPLVLAVRMLNAGTQPAQIRLGWAHAGPSPDEIFTGFNAMVRYWESVRRGAGFLATVPPGAAFETSTMLMGHHDVASGLMDLVADSGEHLYVDVISRDPADAPATFADVPGSGPELPVTPFEFPGIIDEELDYEVGGRYGHLSIGRNDVHNDQGIALAGAYGISHRVRVNVSNPTDRPAVLELALRAGGGVARSVTMIAGRLDCSGNLGAANEHLMDRRELAPGASMTIPLEIIPTAGSNLPFTLVVRSTLR